MVTTHIILVLPWLLGRYLMVTTHHVNSVAMVTGQASHGYHILF